MVVAAMTQLFSPVGRGGDTPDPLAGRVLLRSADSLRGCYGSNCTADLSVVKKTFQVNGLSDKKSIVRWLYSAVFGAAGYHWVASESRRTFASAFSNAFSAASFSGR